MIFKHEDLKVLLDATLRILESSKTAAEKNDINAEIQFLNLYIAELLTRVLSINIDKMATKKEKFEVAKANFETIKLGIQEAVALGFQDALQKYSKIPIEYYCVVRTVPQSPNGIVTH